MDALWALDALRSLVARVALGSSRAGSTRGSVSTVRSGEPLWTLQSLGTDVALWPSGTDSAIRTVHAGRASGAFGSGWTFRTCGANIPRVALEPLRTHRAGVALRTLEALEADLSLWASRSLEALQPLEALRPLFSGVAGVALGSSGAGNALEALWACGARDVGVSASRTLRASRPFGATRTSDAGRGHDEEFGLLLLREDGALDLPLEREDVLLGHQSSARVTLRTQVTGPRSSW